MRARRRLFAPLVIFAFLLCFSTRVSAQVLPPSPPEQAPAPNTVPTPPTSLSQLAFTTADDADYREDFSSLKLGTSSFFPVPPILGQKDDNPKMPFIRERWQLMWRPADPIDVFVCKPREATGKLPVILYVYTYPSDTERFKDDSWCMTMTSDGFAAVGFVSAYTGYRLEMRSPAATFFTDFRESLVTTVHDVQMILDYLASRGDLDMNRVGMYGQGSGGTIAILSASVDGRIRALDVLTPWADWPTFFAQTRYVSSEKRAIFLAPDFQSNIAPFDPITVLPKVRTKRIRLDNVRKSGPMPDASQAKLEAVALRTTVINGYGDPAAMAKRASNGALFAWLREQLQPNAKPPVALAKSQRVHYFPPETANPLPPLVPLQDLLKQDQQKAAAEEKAQRSAQKSKQQ